MSRQGELHVIIRPETHIAAKVEAAYCGLALGKLVDELLANGLERLRQRRLEMSQLEVVSAWVRDTLHEDGETHTFDVIIAGLGTGHYIESIHESAQEARDRANQIIGQCVNRLDLVPTS